MIGEITCEKMIVALNKIDQIDEVKREKEIAKVNTICTVHINVCLHYCIVQNSGRIKVW